MKLLAIGKKVVWLLGKVKNPPLFLYLLCHYLHIDMPRSLSKQIARANRKDICENEFFLETYDGSNQSVHPDMVFCANEYWLAVTPYPYGMEEYENPCLYYGSSLAELKPVENNPIAYQRERRIGFHLSDPCLAMHKGRLICVYRENTRKEGKTQNYLYIAFLTEKGMVEKVHLVANSEEDPLLSPALVSIAGDGGERMHMYHVRKTGDQSKLMHSVLNDKWQAESFEEHSCEGLPDGYYIWHIAIAFDRGEKHRQIDDCARTNLRGLFLLRNSRASGEFKLFMAKEVSEKQWELGEEIRPNTAIEDVQLCPYKACFVPNADSILYSYIDKQNRYRMTIINRNERV